MGTGYSKTIKDLEKNDPTKSELIFTDTKLGETKLQKLAEGLHHNRTLRRINLTNTNITEIGARYISDALVDKLTISSVTTLILDKNPLGPDGGQYLGAALKQCESLEIVKMNNCGLGDNGAIAIANSLVNNNHIITLELGNNLIGDQAARTFKHALENNNCLEGLSLWKNAILSAGASYLAEGLTRNRSLRWLGLGGNKIGPDGARAFAGNLGRMHIHWLGIGGNSVGDQGSIYIATALKVTTIKLGCADFVLYVMTGILTLSERGCDFLRSICISNLTFNNFVDDGCDLVSIGLGGNGIGDLGAHKLARALWTNTRLEALGLGGNEIGTEGCEHFSEMLRPNSTLKKLILSSNHVDDDGLRALADGLAVNNGLETLLLSANPFTDVGGLYLAEILCKNNQTLRVLDIHDAELSPDGEQQVVEFLRTKSSLHYLGSFYGPRDHKIINIDGDSNLMRRRKEVQRAQAHNTVNFLRVFTPYNHLPDFFIGVLQILLEDVELQPFSNCNNEGACSGE
eukprot:gene9982-2157_t